MMKSVMMCTLSAATLVAQAQDLTIAPVMYVIDGWNITSLLDDTDAVHALLITRETPAPDPEQNVTGVLAVRDGAAWEASAWVGESNESILLWLHENLDLPDPLHPDQPWPLDGLVLDEPFVVASEPVPFGKGVVADHPLADAIALMDDPSPILGLLEVMGEAAAASVITAGGVSPNPIGGGGVQPGPTPSPQCPPVIAQRYWDAIAASVEAYFIDPALVNSVFDETIDPLPPGTPRACCRPRTMIVGPTNWGPWSCGGPWSVRVPTPPAHGCSVTAFYTQVITRERTRICSRIYFNCTTSTVTQRQTQTADFCESAIFDRTDNGCDGLTFVPPAVPPQIGECGPNCGITGQTSWSPACQ
jgi:hypothetical protein